MCFYTCMYICFWRNYMKRKSIHFCKLFLFILGFSLVLASCSKANVVVTIDDKKLTMEDFLYDIYLAELEKNTWNETYKETLGIDYWDYEFEGINMESLTKDTIMTRVILYEVLYDQATKISLSLTREEEDKAEADALNLIQSMTEKQLEDSGLNKDILIKKFRKLSLGDKYYQVIIRDFEVNEQAIKSSIDPIEYREYKTECLYVPTVLTSYQSIVPLDEDELTEAYNKILNAKELIQSQIAFSEIPNKIHGLTYYERNFIFDDNTAEEEYKDVAMNMENGEYSDIVSTKFGYYIIHMLDNDSSHRLEKAIDNTIQEKKMNQFNLYYDELLKEYNISINTDYWDKLELDSIIN